ncbi:RNA polymerase sigma factor [Nocardioides sp. R1-1]|uniref:RNA polymerase sigma factor n=1 Tax=Nocardioides sp. R1-1 TaxID=3383502 RepID=UPI0038CF7130
MEASEFEAFFRSMFPKLVRYAQRRVDPEQAEDLAATALQTIWVKNLPSCRDEVEERQLQSLAYRVVDGLSRNAWRKDRASRGLVEKLSGHAATAVPDVADEVSGESWPEWATPLSLTDREVLDLLVDGYRVAEIAVILGCTPAAVTMRLQRAKKNARRLWMREVTRHEEERSGDRR